MFICDALKEALSTLMLMLSAAETKCETFLNVFAA
jgi:hypothetical protein